MKQLVRSSHHQQVLDHIYRWSSCTTCPLHQTSSQKVFFGGQIPCDVLFIGEAPGDGEDEVGLPFVGPTADIMQRIVDATIGKRNNSFVAIPEPVERTTGRFVLGIKQTLVPARLIRPNQLRFCITNAVCCCPPTENNRIRQPNREEIASCSPRLEEFVQICNPKLIVTLGRIADLANLKLLSTLSTTIRSISVNHPGSLFHKDDPDLEEKRIIVAINGAISNIFGPN